MLRKSCLAALPPCLLFVILLSIAANAQSVAVSPARGQTAESGKPTRPNILFIIMDDVGIDQMQIFGYGGATPPLTPNINAIARAGVRFRNVWAMPECSPSRAIFFEGRYPLRTNVFGAILSDDLANSQVSPYEVTTPRVLRTKNYTSALFGKFHLAGPDNNEFTNATPHVLGWDYFDGFLEGAPHPIDTSIGGQFSDPTLYTCGFIPNTQQSPNGADAGACVQPSGACTELTKSPTVETPGFACLQQGGIFVKNEACRTAVNKNLLFTNANAYYVWNRVLNNPDGSVVVFPLTSPSVRGYVSDATVEAAAAWIKLQNQTKKPWMSTVSFANIHTPYQQPPQSLLPGPTPDTTGFACTGNTTANEIATRVISNQMLEAMDTEIGNLMVSTGLAGRNPDGSLDYHPEDTNTMVIIIGDNGTFAPGVKVPFDFSRAKGYVYQTGVWVPLIVSGPIVASPDREVTSMVNVADLFQFFGEIAGIDVHKVVPTSHILDSQSMLPYLTNPNQPSIRTTNFTQTGNNIHLAPPPPCVIPLTDPPTCVQLFNSKALCNFEGGAWYGTNPDGGTSYSSCCDVKRAVYDPSNLPMETLPVTQEATRNDNFKLVRKQVEICAAAPGTDVDDMVQTQNEFYQVNENVPLPAIDKDGTALCEGTACPTGLTSDETTTYNQLTSSMNATLASEPSCPGDGNEDKVVDGKDVQNWKFFNTHGIPVEGQPPNTSSWYDFFPYDGSTDNKDLQLILQNLGTHCLKK
jgi:Sulfatase